ncbi:TPA: hypothetical protein RI785_002316 [Vibrio cholerae]|nr:hypothetical protein [Vibrio cholerae]
MNSINYIGNKSVDCKLNIFAQLELDKLNCCGNDDELERLNNETDLLSKLLQENHRVFVKNKVIDIPDIEISDSVLNNLIQKIRARNGEAYFDDVDEIYKPLNIERIKSESGNIFVRIEFSNDPLTVKFLHELKSDGLLISSGNDAFPKIRPVTPIFKIVNIDTVKNKVLDGIGGVEFLKAMCEDFISQKPEYAQMHAKKRLLNKHSGVSVEI